MFTDTAKILIRSGKGGDGHVSFRREIFVPAGGPDGGNGGRGGDIIFEVDLGMNTLNDFRYKRKYIAEDGEDGKNKRCAGKDGEDLIIKVPEGTVIKDADTGKIITDMSYDNRRELILKGGRGGKGNMNYATATMQAPQYAQPGKSAIEMNVILELKVIADVGLVGFPNVGKSTLLSSTTNAKPKIANYHFTTLNPNLGVVDFEGGKGFVMADIPGLIEGASDGIGLGHEFLKHVERTKLLLHLVDGASIEGRDPVDDIIKINNELASFNENILNKPQIIVANKIDALTDEAKEELKNKLENAFPDKKVFLISAISKENIKELMYYIKQELEKIKVDKIVYEREYFPVFETKEMPYTVEYDQKDHVYVVEGPRIERMLGYTNLESEKGFKFFQEFMKINGILDELEKLGINEGDTVRIYGWEFEYYK